jgi:hypothetical protein
MLRTRDYELHRREIDHWFTFIRAIGKHSYFSLRPPSAGRIHHSSVLTVSTLPSLTSSLKR